MGRWFIPPDDCINLNKQSKNKKHFKYSLKNLHHLHGLWLNLIVRDKFFEVKILNINMAFVTIFWSNINSNDRNFRGDSYAQFFLSDYEFLSKLDILWRNRTQNFLGSNRQENQNGTKFRHYYIKLAFHELSICWFRVCSCNDDSTVS